MSTEWKSPETAPTNRTLILMYGRVPHLHGKLGLVVGRWSTAKGGWATALLDGLKDCSVALEAWTEIPDPPAALQH